MWHKNLDEMSTLADQLDDDCRGRMRSMEFYISSEMGDRERMDRALAKITELGEDRQRMHMLWIAKHGWAMQSILDGDFRAAELHSREALNLGHRTHGEHVEGIFGIQMFTIRREEGRLAEVAPVIKRLVDEKPRNSTWMPGFALVL